MEHIATTDPYSFSLILSLPSLYLITEGVSSSTMATFGLGAIQCREWVLKNSHLHGTLGILSLVGLVAFVIAFSLGVGAIPWIVMSEILPASIKGLAGSVATLLNWMTSWEVTMITNLLFMWSSGGTFASYAIVSAFTVVFVTLWVPETKGRTLEEIQWSFR